MFAHPIDSQVTTSTQLQGRTKPPAMNFPIPTDFFWMMLQGGYVGMVSCQHPIYEHSHLTVQQFIEPDSFGIAFYRPDTLVVLQASIVTHEQVVEQLEKVEFQSDWSFYPSIMDDPSSFDELAQG